MSEDIPDSILSQMRLVLEMSDLDHQIQELETSLKKIPLRRSEMETDLGHRKQETESKSNALAQLEKNRRDKEAEVALSSSRLKDFQAKLSQIKTNKEYQAANKEVSETQKANKKTEDEILEMMTLIEKAKQEKDLAEENLKNSLAVYEKETRDLGEEENRLTGLIDELVETQKLRIPGLDKKVLAQYQRIRKMKWDAVSMVDGGTCRGCHMKLPPQLFIEVQKLKSIHTCPACHRILYLQQWKPKNSQNGLESAPK